MELRTFESVAEYYNRVEPFLLLHEVEDNLILGLCRRMMRLPPEIPPYLALIEQSGEVIAAALMTPPRNVNLSITIRPEAFALLIPDLRAKGLPVPGVMGADQPARYFAHQWQQATGQPYHLHRSMRIYQLRAVTAPNGVSGQLRKITPAERELAVEWAYAFAKEALDEDDREGAGKIIDRYLSYTEADLEALYFWEDDGQLVSMAVSTRPTPNGVGVTLVYTPPELRGRGYASACVAGISQRMLDRGRTFCFLFTDLANLTSNKIYQDIGYRPVCDVNEYKFGNHHQQHQG
jgi:predicted GNAT family acetyltransferase